MIKLVLHEINIARNGNPFGDLVKCLPCSVFIKLDQVDGIVFVVGTHDHHDDCCQISLELPNLISSTSVSCPNLKKGTISNPVHNLQGVLCQKIYVPRNLVHFRLEAILRDLQQIELSPKELQCH